VLSIEVAAALEALRSGLVVGFPTDTVYGIAADPFDPDAVERLFAAKDRERDKAIPILAASVDQAMSIGVIEGAALSAALAHWPGPLTLVVPRVAGLPDCVGDPDTGSVGIRVPDHPVALELLSEFGPVAATSANPAGIRPATDDAWARTMLGDSVAVYLPGSAMGGDASTVVDVTGPEPVVLRPGPIEWETK